MASWPRQSLYTVLLALASLGAAAQTPVPLPPPAPAQGLLVAPVQATWAANHPEHWRAMGIGSLAFMGIFGAFGDNPWAVDGRPDTTGKEDQLLGEVALANRRLGEDAGMAGNFLHFPMIPEAAWLAEPAPRRALLRGLGDAAAFAQLAGLRGIVADTGSSAAVWQTQWDGYAPERRDLPTLDAAARQLGRDAMGIMAKAFPHLELLLIADDMPRTGPLWLAFVAGLIEGIGAADTISLHVLLRESAFETRPAAMEALITRTQRLIAQHLTSERDQHRWQRQGSVGLGLRPLGRNAAGEPVRYYGEGEFRVQLSAAKALCPAWFWVEDPAQTWWQVNTDQAAQYDTLLQKPGLISEQTRETVPGLDAYAWHTSFDALRRVGPLESVAGPATVFQAEAGAAVVFWAPPPALEGVPPGQTVHVTRLRDGDVSETVPSGDGRLALTEGEPCLVTPLPEAAWSLPAALWIEANPVLTPGLGGARLHFGFRNPLPHPALGRLQVTPPVTLGIGTANPAFNLAPEEASQHARTVQGVLDTQPGYEFAMALLLPEGGGRRGQSVRRTFTLPVAPPVRATVFLEATPLGTPVWRDDETEAGLLILATPAGVTAIDSGGGIRWRWQSSWPLITPAVITQGPRGETAIATADAAGGLVRLGLQGELLERVALEAPAAPGPLVAERLFDAPGDVLVYAGAGGGVAAASSRGAPLWVYGDDALVRHLNLWTGPGDPIILAATSHTLYALDAVGALLWRAQTAGRASTPPEAAPGMEGDLTVSVGTVHGYIQRFDALTGQEHPRFMAPGAAGVFGLKVLAGPNPDAASFFTADASRVHALNAAGAPVWSYPAPGVTAISIAHVGGAPVLLLSADSGLHALGIDGTLRWHDPRSAARVVGEPLTLNLKGSGEQCAVYAAADRSLRILDLGPRNRPRAPIGSGR
jgi:outer membrane protein assembly factor BamB